MDHFTRFVQVYVTKNKAAKTFTDKIINDYAFKVGFPSKIQQNMGNVCQAQRALWSLWVTHSTLPPTRKLAERLVQSNCLCFKLLLTKRKQTGRSPQQKWCMPTIARRVKQQVPLLPFGQSSHLPINPLFNLNPEKTHSTNEDDVISYKRKNGGGIPNCSENRHK